MSRVTDIDVQGRSRKASKILGGERDDCFTNLMNVWIKRKTERKRQRETEDLKTLKYIRIHGLGCIVG